MLLRQSDFKLEIARGGGLGPIKLIIFKSGNEIPCFSAGIYDKAPISAISTKSALCRHPVLAELL